MFACLTLHIDVFVFRKDPSRGRGALCRFSGSFSVEPRSLPNSTLRFSELIYCPFNSANSRNSTWDPPPFSTGCSKLRAEHQGSHEACLVCFPSLRDHRSDLSVAQCLKTVVLYISSNFLVFEGRRINPLPVFLLWFEAEGLYRTHV